MWWMQIAPSRVRGALGSINQLVICIGIVSALTVNVVLPATSWRTMFYLASLPALLLGLGEQCSGHAKANRADAPGLLHCSRYGHVSPLYAMMRSD